MKPEVVQRARQRMSRATEALSDARLLVETGSIEATVNRAYYAAFYAASAPLATRELESPKHGGLIRENPHCHRIQARTRRSPPGVRRQRRYAAR